MQSSHFNPQSFHHRVIDERMKSSAPLYAQKALPQLPPKIESGSPLDSPVSQTFLRAYVIPSPSLYDENEMLDAFSRISLSAETTRFNSYYQSDRESFQSLEDLYDWTGHENCRSSSIFLPDLQFRSDICERDRCSTPEVIQSHPIYHSQTPSKRSVTPANLTQLSTEFKKLIPSDLEVLMSTSRPSTPVPSLSYSHSFVSVIDNSFATIIDSKGLAIVATDLSMSSPASVRRQATEHTPHSMFDTGSDGHNGPLLTNHRQTTFQTTSSSPRTSPKTPQLPADPAQHLLAVVDSAVPSLHCGYTEVSHIDWDDDDKKTPLERVKKSFTNLRDAAKPRPESGPRRSTSKAVEMKTDTIEPSKTSTATVHAKRSMQGLGKRMSRGTTYSPFPTTIVPQTPPGQLMNDAVSVNGSNHSSKRGSAKTSGSRRITSIGAFGSLKSVLSFSPSSPTTRSIPKPSDGVDAARLSGCNAQTSAKVSGEQDGAPTSQDRSGDRQSVLTSRKTGMGKLKLWMKKIFVCAKV